MIETKGNLGGKSNRYKITKSLFAIGGYSIVEDSPVGELITQSVS
jgi:hypothetical protein